MTLALDGEKTVSQVRLTFDPNLNHCIKMTMSSERIAQQGFGVPPELVKDYSVVLKRKGEIVASQQVEDNYQRLNVLDFAPVVCDRVDVHVTATNGYADARIYEIRVY